VKVVFRVDPESHGRGIAKSALALADCIFPDLTLNAKVLEANLPSQKLFESAGYQRLSSEKFSRERFGGENNEII
jgi:UDP-2,4-diacetamido-2,4,6-trideoxy-beta-L-altropyranose hydrolase